MKYLIVDYTCVDFIDIGYNPEKYKEWMRIDAIYIIIKNAREAKNYVEQQGYNAVVAQIDYEIEEYKRTL